MVGPACVVLLLAGALGLFHWGPVDLFYDAVEKVNEFSPEACLVAVGDRENVMVVYENVDDRAGDWLYSLGYHLWDPDDSSLSKFHVGIPGTAGCRSPSVVSDGVGIWVFYDPEGPWLQYGALDPVTGLWTSGPHEVTPSPDLRLISGGDPSAVYVSGSDSTRDEIWLAYTGVAEVTGKAKKGSVSTSRDIYLEKGWINPGTGEIVWYDEDKLTEDPGVDYDPSILRTKTGETWIAWRSMATGEYQIWASRIDESGLKNPKPVTTFSGWYPDLQDRGGEVWLYYTMWQCTAGRKKLLDHTSNTWSNFIRISDARERVDEATPISLPPELNTPESSYHDLLVVEKTQWVQIQPDERYYLTRLGHTEWDEPGTEPVPPHTEIEITAVEYQAARGVLTVKATVTEPVDYIVLSGTSGSGPSWQPIYEQSTGMQARCLDPDGDLIYEFAGKVTYTPSGDEPFYSYVMGTSVDSADLRPSTFDVMYVSIQSRPAKK